MLSLGDVQTLANMAMSVEQNPAHLAGRLLGLTPEEQRTAPRWGWWALAIGGVVAVGFAAAMYSRSSATEPEPSRKRSKAAPEPEEDDDESEDEDEESEEDDDEEDEPEEG